MDGREEFGTDIRWIDHFSLPTNQSGTVHVLKQANIGIYIGHYFLANRKRGHLHTEISQQCGKLGKLITKLG